MKKVVSGLFISLDGVTEAPDQWQFDHFDAEMEQSMAKFINDTDTVLMGRVTYQEWAGYWPTATHEPFASFINNVPKYVVSTTLNSVEWKNSTLLKGPLVQDIQRLKQGPGSKDITVTGSPGLVYSLLQADLLDELTLTIHPVVAGKGKRLFKDNSALKRMKLTQCLTTSTGVLIATYQPRAV